MSISDHAGGGQGIFESHKFLKGGPVVLEQNCIILGLCQPS